MVSFIIATGLPSGRVSPPFLIRFCTEPLPKERWPTINALPRSFMAPDKISEADALYSLTSTIIDMEGGMSVEEWEFHDDGGTYTVRPREDTIVPYLRNMSQM